MSEQQQPEEGHPVVNAAMSAALERLVVATAQENACRDLNDAYVHLQEFNTNQFVNPAELERSFTAGARVSDNTALYLTYAYRQTYLETLNEALQSDTAEHTPSEVAMRRNLLEDGQVEEHDRYTDAELAEIQKLRAASFPAAGRDQHHRDGHQHRHRRDHRGPSEQPENGR